MAHRREPYNFVILDVKEIQYDLNLMGCAVDEKNLQNPTCEVIWPLYEAIAQYLLQISRDEFLPIAFSKCSALPYTELHEESPGCFASWQTIQKLMFSAGNFDVTVRDLLKPDSSRTIKFLSGIINYARFRKDYEERVAELQSETLLESWWQLEEELERTNREIASIEAERESQAPVVASLEVENDELWQEIVSLNKKQAAYQGEIRSVKQELNSITDAIAGQKYMLQQAKQEGSELKAQLIESPEKLERELQEKKATLETTEVAAEEARKSLHRWKLKLESYTKAEQKMQKLSALSEEAHRLLSEQKTASKELKAVKAKLKADEEEDRQRKTKLAELALKGKHFQDIIDKAEGLNLEKSKEEEKLLVEAKAQYASFLKRQELVKARIGSKKAQLQHLLGQKAVVLNTKDEIIRSSQQETALIQQQVLEYYRSLLSCTGPVPQLEG